MSFTTTRGRLMLCALHLKKGGRGTNKWVGREDSKIVRGHSGDAKGRGGEHQAFTAREAANDVGPTVGGGRRGHKRKGGGIECARA